MVEIMILSAKIGSLVIFSIIGYFLAAKNTLGKDGKTVVSALLNRVALPFLILVAYSNIKINFELMYNIVIVFIMALLVFTLNYLYASFISKRKNFENKISSVFITGGCHGNTAFLAFALLFAVYGSEGLFYATMYYLVDNILFAFNGIERLRKNHHEKTSIPPVTITLVAALFLMIFLSITKIDISNNFIYSAFNDIANLTTPLAFLFIGMAIYGSDFKKVLTNIDVVKLLIAKMIVVPLVIIGVLYIINFDLSIIILMVIITQASMPPVSALMSFSYEYKQDMNYASSLVIIGHFLAIISIPIIFSIGLLIFK